MADEKKQEKKRSRYQIDGKRADYYYVDPEQVTVVDDPADPLYDERIKLPINEEMVRSIMVDGVEIIVDITKRKVDGEDVFVVVDGRQRHKNLIEARRRLRVDGVEDRDLPRLPVRLKRGDAKRLAGIGHTANADSMRKSDGIMLQARKMAHYMETTGADEAECAIKFGCNKETVKNRLKLLELDHEVHKAIEKGDINVTAALKLHGLSPADQREKLKELKEQMRSSADRNGAGARKVREVTRQPPERRLPGHKPRTEPERRALIRRAVKQGKFDPDSVQSRTRKALKWEHVSKVMAWLLDPETPDDDITIDVPGGKAFIEEFGSAIRSLLAEEREKEKKKAEEK